MVHVETVTYSYISAHWLYIGQFSGHAQIHVTAKWEGVLLGLILGGDSRCDRKGVPAKLCSVLRKKLVGTR